ncbi:MAG TPA: tetratricopeptide repeat protein [Bryobacteraceae bacterium]|nr:tetratricopeptide repeat protein [Bryobacteraceae bacterium]
MGRLLSVAALFIYTAAGQTGDLASESHQARELMGQGRFEEAIPIYEKLVQALPGNLGLVLNLGLAEEMAGHPAKAVPHFETVLKKQPENLPALTSLAAARLQLHQPSLAAVQYRKLTELDASDPQSWYGLGKAYEALATRDFDQLSKAAPESPYVAALIAESRVQRRQYRSAFFFYRQAESKLPDLPGLHAGLARVYQKTGHADWAAAEERKEPPLPAKTCTQHTAECEFLKNNFLAAAKFAEASSTPESLFWATRAYSELALKAFDKLGYLPDSVEMHALKAQILHDHGQDIEASREWRAALKLNPGDPALEQELAKSLFIGKDYHSAAALAEKLLAQQPDSPDLNFIVGDSLWQTQQPEKALPYLEAALRGRPKMLPAHAALGMALALLDRNSEAIPHLQQALSLDDDGSLHYNLARAYRAAGNAQGAQQMMEQYQQIKQRNAQVDSELAKQAEISAPAK